MYREELSLEELEMNLNPEGEDITTGGTEEGGEDGEDGDIR